MEALAARDPEPEVRRAALETLTAPVYRQWRARSRAFPPNLRKALLKEIAIWERDGLLDADQVAVLRERYTPHTVDTTAPRAKASTAPTPDASLPQRLFSETSIKIALYLGAFFVIGAGLILAALVEFARLPTLLLLTLGFGVPALALRKRLPQPAFALFLVASMLLLITAGVIAGQSDFSNQTARGYWTLVFWGMAAVWGSGVYLYRSRLFSLFAFLVALAGTLTLSGWLDWEEPTLLPLIAALCLGGLLWADALRRWQTPRFAYLLFWVAKAVLAFLLLFAFGHALAFWDEYNQREYGWALVNALAWLIASIDFALTRQRFGFRIFRFAALAALLPIPWLTLVGLGLSPNADAQIITQWVWGALLAALSLPLERAESDIRREYALPTLLASSAVFLGTLLLPFTRPSTSGTQPLFLTLCGIALVYSLLQTRRPHFAIWLAALMAAVGAFFTFFKLPFMENVTVFAGYKLAAAGLVLLLPDILRKTGRDETTWRWPPRGLGLLVTAANVLYLLTVGWDYATEAAVIFGIYAIFGLAYASAWGRASLGWSATASLALGLIFILQAVDYALWVWPLTALAALYYLSGLWLTRRENLRPWGDMLRASALTLAALTALSAPLEKSTAWVSLWVALNASLYAVEAWRTRNVWLGFPTNLIYLIAYTLLLSHLEVTQPQFYAVGAAALGLVMHYLLTRSGNRVAAFLTGMLSQLALLSTTYIQMIAEEQFIYFAVLFAQALVVLLYGVVIRSRSLVITPIAFVVLAVVTVAFNILQGLSSVLLVGCTGIALLLFGTLALVLRERFTGLRNRWRGWNP